MQRRWWIAGLFAGLALAGGIYFRALRPKPEPASFVDPALCAGCHADVWRTYQRTGMARSFYRPRPLGNPATFYHQPSDSYFAMIEREGRTYQRRYQIGFDGKETNLMEKSVDYVMGSGNHARTYLHRTERNTLAELPLGWYAEKGGSWAMNPGYDRPDHQGFRRNITNACMFCHNAKPQVPSEATEAVFPGKLPEGIDCQRCHGPGSKHARQPLRTNIVNPARLSPDREMEVCMQCHLETTSFNLPNAIVRYERGPFSYVPGEPLQDFILHFDQANGNARFEIVGAAYRLRRSACFLKSAGAMRCTTCHNPHDIPRGEQAAAHYTQVCRQCHGGPFEQKVAAGQHTNSADCIGCHMPKRRTEDVVHAVMTDHLIQRRKPEGDLLQPIVERHETEEDAYRGEVFPYYPREPVSDLYRAIAQVSQNSNLRQGIQQLRSAIDKTHPGRVEYELHLGDALAANGQTEQAVTTYEQAAQHKPDSFAALRKLGPALRSAGQVARAVDELKRASALAPGDAPTWHELGLTYLNQGLKADASSAFQHATELDPDLPEAFNSLGGVRLETGDIAGAEIAFREAVRIQPDYVEAHSNLGNVLSSSNRFEEARFHFETATRLKPDDAAARYNYAVALARVRRYDQAQIQVERELKSHPNIAEAHDLLGNLLVARGHVAAAIEHYRKAIQIRPEFGRALLDLGEALAESGDVKGALPYLRKAAESPDPAVRQEAAQTLQQLPHA